MAVRQRLGLAPALDRLRRGGELDRGPEPPRGPGGGPFHLPGQLPAGDLPLTPARVPASGDAGHGDLVVKRPGTHRAADGGVAEAGRRSTALRADRKNVV